MLTVHLLGSVEVRRDGVAVDLGGPQQRAVLCHLALEVGRVVSVERLIDRLWGDEPPRTPLGTLQSYVSRLRRAVEPDRAAGTVAQVLVSEPPGYLLRLPPEQIDVHRFRTLVADARASAAEGRHTAALERFDAALGLWRGPALGGVGNDDQVRAAIVQLDEERQSAIEDRFDTLLTLGRHTEAVPLLQAAVDERPLRERLWALLALSLYRSSRQAEALRALATARSVLLDELGLDPGPELQDLERRILAQDPVLVRAVAPGAAPAPPVPEPPRADVPELIGRNDEWQALHAALTAAGAGRPQLALLEGEPGTGKSTLSDVFLAHAATHGWRTVTGRCVEPGLAPTLWPCIEIVRTMLGDEPASAPPDRTMNPLRRLVARADEPGLSLTPVEMADQFVTLLDELGNQRWAILLDDLQWADRATLDVVRLVLERLGTRRVTVIGAHRPPELVPDSLLGSALGGLLRSAVGTTRIKMSPLDAPEVARLMEITAGVAPSSEVAQRVRARAGGNPLFVVELARLAGERGLSDDSAVPEAIRDVVRGRLAQLPVRATAELEVAAVLGERFNVRTVMAVSERDPEGCLDALDAAIVTRILVAEGDELRFAHALVRDAVLAEISTLRLARLHRRAAEAIVTLNGDTADVAEPVAHHLLAAAAFADPVDVAKALVRASDVARWRGALDTGDRLADRALTVLSGVPRTPEVSAVEVEALESMVSAAYRRDNYKSNSDVVARVREVADRTGSDAAMALWLFLTWGDIDETEDLAEIAEGVERVRVLAARTTDSYAIVTTRYMLAAYALLVGRLDEAAEHAAMAIAASGATDPDTPPTHVPLVMLPAVAGVVEAVRDHADLAREHTHRRAQAWLSQRSEVDATASIALAFNRALIEALLGHADQVLAELGDTPRPAGAGFVKLETATCNVLAGWARARLGDPDGLVQACDAMQEIERGTERILQACLRTFVADAYMAQSDPRAVGLLEQARAEALARGEIWWLSETVRLQAEADRAFGDGRRADGLLDDAEELATRHGARLVLERIGAMRAEAGARSR